MYVFLILLLVSFERCPPTPKNAHFHSHFCLNSLQPFNSYSSHISSLSFSSNLPRKQLSISALICAHDLSKVLVRTQRFLKIWSGRGVLALGYSAAKWMFDTLVLERASHTCQWRWLNAFTPQTPASLPLGLHISGHPSLAHPLLQIPDNILLTEVLFSSLSLRICMHVHNGKPDSNLI